MIPITAQPTLSRRELMKAGVAATAAMTVGIPITKAQEAAAQSVDAGIEWHKGVGRLRRTGYGM